MKKLARILLLATAISSTSLYAGDDPVVAKYKDGEVKESQVFELVKPSFESDPSLKNKTFGDLDKNAQEAIIKQFTVSKLLEQEAKSSGIESSKDFQTKLENAKNNILRAEYIEQNVKKTVTEDKIKQKADEIKKSLDGQNEIKVSHILVETETEAKNIKSSLDAKKAKFEDLAKKYSKDQGSGSKGGKIQNYIRRGAGTPQTFEDKAFSMSKGQISSPVKTDYGWHIIKVDDIRPIKITDDEIKQQATQVINAEAVNKIIDDIVKKYDLKVIPIEKATEDKKPEVKAEDKKHEVKAEDKKHEVKAEDKKHEVKK